MKASAMKDVKSAEQLEAVGSENYIRVVGGNLLNSIEALDLEVKYLGISIGSARGSNHRGTIRLKSRKKREAIAELEDQYNEVVNLASRFNITSPLANITSDRGYAQIKGNPDALKTLECIIGYTRWKRVVEEITYLHEELDNLMCSRRNVYIKLIEDHTSNPTIATAISITRIRPVIHNDISVLNSFKVDAYKLESLF